MSQRMFEACGKQVLSKSDESQLAVSSTSAPALPRMQPDQGPDITSGRRPWPVGPGNQITIQTLSVIAQLSLAVLT